MRALILAASLIALAVTPASGQEPAACTYDDCALMLKSGFLGTRLVRGTAETPIASLILFAPRLHFMGGRSDSAGRFYASFRSKRNSGTWLTFAGAALFAGALIVDGESEELAIGLAVTGFGSLMFGAIRAWSGQNDLARAVWWYNRGLQ